MRVALLLLVLVNLGFYAWSQFWVSPGAGDAHLVDQQMNREAIRILKPGQVEAARRDATKVTACMELGGFNLAEVPKVDEQLAPLGNRVSQRRVDDTASWWVFMPPQGSREAALKKVVELKRLGIEELFVLQDDPKVPFSISLGVFRSEESARNRFEQLRERGVRTAQVGRRPTAVQRVVYEIRAVDDEAANRLAALKAAWPGTELKECARPDSVSPTSAPPALGAAKAPASAAVAPPATPSAAKR
jgi:hypothetical protein